MAQEDPPPRPDFQAKTTAEAEDFFTESLEAWRAEMKLDKMVLLGHSFGGYMSAAYALKYPGMCVCPLDPIFAFRRRIATSHRTDMSAFAQESTYLPERVERLILASPVGVPRRPKPEDDRSALMAYTRTRTHTLTCTHTHEHTRTHRFANHPQFGVRLLISAFRGLWDFGATPQGVVRLLGPFGPRLVGVLVR